MREARGPILRQPNWLSGRHLNHSQHLPRDGNERVVSGTADFKGAPETGALHAFQAAMDDESVAQPGGAFVIDLRADDDWIGLRRRHLDQAHAELLGEERARDFDEAQVDDIVDHSRAVGIEKHDLDGGFDTRSLDGGRLGR